MENINLKNLESWMKIRDLYLSNDKESWKLADSILEQADQKQFKNQISSLIKVIPDDRSEIKTYDNWSHIISSEINTGTKESVQMIADIYTVFLTNILFHDEVFSNFEIKLKYKNGEE